MTSGRVRKAGLRLPPLVACAVLATAAPALADAPWWRLASESAPTHLPRGGTGTIIVTASNLGDAPMTGMSSPVSVADSLPLGLTATAISGHAGVGSSELGGSHGKLVCSLAGVSCKFDGTLAPFEPIELEITVAVGATLSGPIQNQVTVTGGGAPLASQSTTLTADASPTPFGVEEYALRAEDESGLPDTQAGSHPFQLTSTLALNEPGGRDVPPVPVRDLRFALPPGLVGNVTRVPQCTGAEFSTLVSGNANLCPPATAIGAASVTFLLTGGPSTLVVPVFNLQPAPGEPARFGFEAARVPTILDTAVRTGGDYGVEVSVRNISEAVAVLSSRVTLTWFSAYCLGFLWRI
jgi:hypothetical protein